MNLQRIRELIGFYENELINNILSFWLPNCIDTENGGYFNCYDNHGRQLISRDKFTWSQGRFVWMFSSLATMKETFTFSQREKFLAIAKTGRDFLKKNCLIAPEDWRCVFLTDEAGNHKPFSGYQQLDMSIYADCFVIIAFGKYADAAEDEESYLFCKKLYQSCIRRIKTGEFNTLPYPLSKKYRAHGIPMILSNVTREIYSAAEKFDTSYCKTLRENLKHFTTDILTHFVDENHLLHEIITSDDRFTDNILGQHLNPGHTLEDMWFMIDAADILDEPQNIPLISSIAKEAIHIGWDQEYGGLLHFCGINGGKPEGSSEGIEHETMYRQLVDSWGDKLWWVHSEALYTTLLCYDRTHDQEFLEQYSKIFDYTFEHFPNTNSEIREWIQILSREGKPVEKVVALPVKDPYHITRNFMLMIDLLYAMKSRFTVKKQS